MSVIQKLKRIFGAGQPELNEVCMIGGREKVLFEKALKLYVFVHHKSHELLDAQLSEQLIHTGNAVYSLLLNWLRDGRPSLEYMDFLNEKLTELRSINHELRAQLKIQPEEVEELELSQSVNLVFRDASYERVLRIRYEPESGRCRFGIN